MRGWCKKQNKNMCGVVWKIFYSASPTCTEDKKLNSPKACFAIPYLTSVPSMLNTIHFCRQSIDIQSISIQIPSRIVQVLTYLSDTAFHLPRFTILNWIATICSDNFLYQINVYLYSVFYKACITSQMHLPASYKYRASN